jgi:multiple sugar transport system substrate-binding protein
MRKSTLSYVFYTVMLLSILLASCGTPTAAPTEPPAAQPTVAVEVTKEVVVTQQVEITSTPAPDRVQITWYIGLGAGAQAAQIPLEKAFADKFNASQSEIQLIPVIVDNKYAKDNLTAQIAAGNAPDIVGPVGTAGRMAFPGAFLDMEPLVKEFNYDTSDIDPAFNDFYRDEGKLVGLPFAIFPEFMFVNTDLFKEAGLNLPPQKYGEKYKMPDGTEVEWNFDTLATIGKILTVDAKGNDATSANFDAKNIVQYGWVPQWTDHPRAVGTLFGAWDMVAADGTAVFPDSARAALKYYYDAMWGKQPFAPTKAAMDSNLLGPGNAFMSGKVAMATTHLWYTCCIKNAEGKFSNWDTAVMPSYNGKVTAKLHGDTFAIMAATTHPKEAFKVYTYMLGEGAADLYTIYGGLPARKSQQAAFFEGLDKTYAPLKINWQVATDSIPFMDVPNHEHVITKYFTKVWDIGSTLTTKLQTDGKITDVNAAIDEAIKQWNDALAGK